MCKMKYVVVWKYRSMTAWKNKANDTAEEGNNNGDGGRGRCVVETKTLAMT